MGNSAHCRRAGVAGDVDRCCVRRRSCIALGSFTLVPCSGLVRRCRDQRHTVRVSDYLSAEPHALLDRLPVGAATDLARLGTRRRYPAGVSLMVEGDASHEVLMLESGSAIVSVTSEDGREIVLDVVESRTLLGELSAIDGGCRSATVTSLSAVEVIAIPAPLFNDFLNDNPEVLRSLLIEVSGRLRTRIRHQMEIGAGDSLGRVCARLVELAGRGGRADGDSVVFRLPVSQANLAGWTGLSREAVVKALHVLRKLGWVENRGKDIVIRDIERVRHRAVR